MDFSHGNMQTVICHTRARASGIATRDTTPKKKKHTSNRVDFNIVNGDENIVILLRYVAS